MTRMKHPSAGYTFLACIGIVALLFFLYLPIGRGLVYDWLNNPDYSHGFLIPVISLYMIWSRRSELMRARRSPSMWGFVILIAGVGQYIAGYIGAEHFLQSTSMLLVFSGIVVFLWGMETMRVLLIPIVFLIFMIPPPAIVWNNFAFLLKLFATKTAVFIMQAIGIIVLREGNVLYLPSVTLEVVDACSGLRSLISLLALGVLMGFVSNFSTWKKWVMFLIAVPIAILSNIARLILTVALAQWYGAEVTQDLQHTASGIFVFAVGLILMLLVYKLLTALNLPSERTP